MSATSVLTCRRTYWPAGKECRPEQYLFIFLKFISAVCPTIEYDYTLEVDGR